MPIRPISFSKIIVFIVYLQLALISAFIIFSMNKGFDFQDESFYLLVYNHTDVYKEGISTYHVIVHKLLQWLNPGLITYRIASLVITLASSFILFRGMHKWAQTQLTGLFASATFLLPYVFTVNFISYFIGLQTINYNTLINAIIATCTGLQLYVLSTDATTAARSKRALTFVAITGILCTFSFFIKFTTGILQLLAYIPLFIVYYIGQPLKARLTLVAAMLAGCVTGLVIYFVFFQSFNDWFSNFISGFHGASSTDHPPAQIIQSYISEIGKFVRFACFDFYWLGLLPLLLLADHRFRRYKAFVYVRNVLVFIVVSYFIYRMYKLDFHRSNFIRNWNYRNGYLYPIVMGLMSVLLLVAAFTRKVKILQFVRYRFRLIVMAVFLFFVPFAGSIGTVNPLFLNLFFNAVAWFCVLVILLAYTAKHIGNIAAGCFLLITLTFSISQIVDGNTFTPYFSAFRDTKTNVFQQTERAEQIPELDGTLIDPASKKFLYDMQALLKARNVPPGYPMWSFSYGITYLMKGVLVEIFWYNKACASAAYYHMENRPPIFIVADGRPGPDKATLECFRNMGINYPEDYEQAGEVWFPHFNTMAKVLFPKNYRQ